MLMSSYLLKKRGRALFLTGLMFAVSAVCLNGEEIQSEKCWTDDDARIFLKLPFKEQFSNPLKQSALEMFNGGAAIPGFLIITNEYESKERIARLLISTADISVFKVAISMPKSCEQACEYIFDQYSSRFSKWEGMVGVVCAEFDNTNKVYRLVERSLRTPSALYLDAKVGLQILVSYSRDDQILGSPVNPDVIEKQMELLVQGVSAIVKNGQGQADIVKQNDKEVLRGYLSAKKHREDHLHHVETLRTPAYPVTNSSPISSFIRNVRGWLGDPSLPRKCGQEQPVKFGLTLSEVMDEGKINLMHSNRLVQIADVHNRYTLMRIDGKIIPTVKIADPQRVNAKLGMPRTGRVDQDVSDILISVTKQNEQVFVDAWLRSNNLYQVSFHGRGKHVLHVSVLNEAGNIAQWGELEVEVDDSDQRLSDTRRTVELGLSRCENYIKPFMRTMRIDFGSDDQLSNTLFCSLASDRLVSMKELAVSHHGQRKLMADIAGGSTNCIGHLLGFSNAKGENIGAAFVIGAPSVREVQMALFSRLLSRSSKPWVGRVEEFYVKRDDLGDLTVGQMCFLAESDGLVANQQSIAWIRNNVAIELATFTPSVSAKQLARMLDDLMIGEK
jgi:hypothetical protein